MATATQSIGTTGGDIASQLAQFAVNIGAALPASRGVGELWEAINAQIVAFTPGGGQPSGVVGPATATAETLPRWAGAESETIAQATGSLYLAAVYLPANTIVNSVNFVSGSTGSTGVTHNWGVLASSARKVLGVSVDNTTTDIAANTVQTYALGTAVTIPSSGLYYIGQMMAVATTAPTAMGYTGTISTLNAIAPILGGVSNTGATTPPALAATLTAITASASLLYGYTT